MSGRPFHLGVSDDLDLLLEALAPGRGGRFLAVSAHGAGEAAIALASAGAGEVLAVDLEDPEHLEAALGLKRAAFALYGREDAMVVYGLRPASALRRGGLARQLARALPGHPLTRYAAEGLVRADRVARSFLAFSWAMARLAGPEAHRAMFYAGDVAAFRRAVSRGWLRPLLAELGRHGHRFFPRAEWEASEYPRELARDPLAYLEGLVASVPADSPLFGPLVRGPDAVLPEPLLPPSLRVAAYDATRARAERVHVQRELPEGPFDGVYLSNVIDYLEPAPRRRLFAELTRALAPGAPVLLYSNEAHPKAPLELGFARDEAASAALAARDRARIYRRIELLRPAAAALGRRLRVV